MNLWLNCSVCEFLENLKSSVNRAIFKSLCMVFLQAHIFEIDRNFGLDIGGLG